MDAETDRALWRFIHTLYERAVTQPNDTVADAMEAVADALREVLEAHPPSPPAEAPHEVCGADT